MKRRKLKQGVWISLYLILIAGLLTSAYVVRNTMMNNSTNDDNLDYVTNSILQQEVPVINEVTKLIKPYTNESVSVAKNYYDYKGTAEEQEKSIIYHDNTYMQNSGVDYVLNETFDVVSVLDGTVTSVKDDELAGKTVEVKHDNDYVTVYQSLSEVVVKKGDTLKQGDIIGKSGTNKLDSDIGNHLHFELYINGQIVNPADYIDKEIKNDNNQEQQTDTNNADNTEQNNESTTENTEEQQNDTQE